MERNRQRDRVWVASIGIAVVVGSVVVPRLVGDAYWLVRSMPGAHVKPWVGLFMPLWSWLFLVAGLFLGLVFGLARSPRRGLVWVLGFMAALFVLQTAELLSFVVSAGGQAGDSRILVAVGGANLSWAVLVLLLVAVAAIVMIEVILPRGGAGRT